MLAHARQHGFDQPDGLVQAEARRVLLEDAEILRQLRSRFTVIERLGHAVSSSSAKPR